MSEESFSTREPLSWSDIKERREEVKSLYPSIFTLPVMYCTKRELVSDVIKNIKGRYLISVQPHRLLPFILTPVLKFLDVDFATGILLIAKRN